MWCLPPIEMCDQHLLGEHKELHQEVGQIEAGNLSTVKGHAEEGQVDTSRIQTRHDALVAEMLRRGMNHDSPLEYSDDLDLGEIDIEQNARDLNSRSDRCSGGVCGPFHEGDQPVEAA